MIKNDTLMLQKKTLPQNIGAETQFWSQSVFASRRQNSSEITNKETKI